VAALREGSTTFGLEGRRSLSFDGAGRLIRAFWGDRSIRRSLDNRYVEKRRVGRYGWRHARRVLSDEEVGRLLGEGREELSAVAASLSAGVAGVGAAHAGMLLERLRPILRWDAAALAGDGARFRSVYLPIPILPPDQYGAVVVQATEGCPHNQCTFCSFYRDRPFRAKPAGEIRAHLRAVRAFFGEGLRTRRGVFLADANSLVLSPDRLEELFSALGEELPLGPGGLGGVGSFIDAFSGAPKSCDEFRRLAGWGLRRIYLGLETGCDALLRLLGKLATADGALAVVRAARAAGVGVGVIVMLGIGGAAYRSRHVQETLEVVRAMGLGSGDILFLSPLVAMEDSSSRLPEQAPEGAPLSDAEISEQFHQLSRGLRQAGGPKLALYDIQDFVY
jgi:hypothetical protein